MNRDEILSRNKEGNPKDEGMEYIEVQSKRHGENGLYIFFAVLVLYNFFKGLPIYDLLSVFWGYLSLGYIYKYQAFKTKKSLLIAILGMVAAICFLLSYILETW
ncbi:DUF6442 family protein [Acetobacterium tundrae]|uniref:Uncharacterized protein n=1 Tax=Acetobacterium tundrae TaxID=132932 RepID=A0ABR6WIB3_9FIRM|nr:DUF6442 family protein [Acetobacterium tundrae]MBC3796238.1 hypothetical protein [Acetobacterium tundrae]